ncbi:MAG: hypothetical protein DSY37_03900 [Hyperthermus sp.]|nr:MAG: hypothetical protein DSY37_03900 [Hyperthermus sp.]
MAPMYPRVEEYMSSPVVAVSPQDTVSHVRRLMLRHRVGRIIVVNEASLPVGVVTRSDLARLLGTERFSRRSLDSILVEEVMTPSPVTVKLNRSVREAARLMLQHGVSGLPVVDDEGRLVGIITKTDIVRAYAERLKGRYRVRDYMYTDPPEVGPQHSVFYVADLLDSHPSRRVLVVDGERLTGIIAPSDIAFLDNPPIVAREKGKRVRRFAELPKGRLGPVYKYMVLVAEDVMTPNPSSVGPDEDLGAAASLMLQGGYSSVPVVEAERPVGIIVKHNLLKALAEK